LFGQYKNGRFRIERITEVVEKLVLCGDYSQGVARIQCTNPDCKDEYFRPFSGKGLQVEPGGYPPGTPTDPYVRISRIRFLDVTASLRRWSAPLWETGEDTDLVAD
jgi:hypothetical protein